MTNVTSLRRTRSVPTYLQLRIELTDIEPAIWRRVVVPGTLTLGKLHQVIQAAMGWTDTHLHEFDIAGCRFGISDADWPSDVVSEKRVRLDTALCGKKTFYYIYDFGDHWAHRIKVEKARSVDLGLTYPLCLDGANACPPEDCGGVPGYETLRAALASPDHPERNEFLTWLGQDFDPAAFDPLITDQALQRIKL